MYSFSNTFCFLSPMSVSTRFLFMVEYLHLWYMFAQVVITVMLATMNYVVFKHCIFARSGTAPAD